MSMVTVSFDGYAHAYAGSDVHRERELNERRRGLRLTQAQLAELTGIKKSSISRIESGTYTPRAAHKIAIAAALATEVSALWIPLTVVEARTRAIELGAA